MKKLLLFTIALVFMLHAPAMASDAKTVKEIIVKHAVEMGVDPAIALSIARTESGYRHEARSSHGAVGVFQLMPSTARRLGVNPYSLSDNIKGGIMYYKMMYNMFGSMELALAAYNAGPGNVKRYKAVPPYSETKRFVNKIMTDYHNLKTNPDPAMVKAMKPIQPQAAPKKVTAPLPAVTVQEAKKVDMPSQTPIELKLDTETFAI